MIQSLSVKPALKKLPQKQTKKEEPSILQKQKELPPA